MFGADGGEDSTADIAESFGYRLTVAALLGTLNGAPSQDVELLLSSASPLYTPVYIAGPYMLVCVVALALVWSRQSRSYMEARRDWRVRRSEDYLI